MTGFGRAAPGKTQRARLGAHVRARRARETGFATIPHLSQSRRLAPRRMARESRSGDAVADQAQKDDSGLRPMDGSLSPD